MTAPGVIESSAGWILGWTIIHSLWQGALVACGLALVLRFVPGSMVRLRAAAAWSAFVLVLTMAGATWSFVEAEWRRHAACWSSETYARQNAAVCAGHAVPAARIALGRPERSVDAVAGRHPVSVAARSFFLARTSGVPVFAVAACALAILAVVRLLVGLKLLDRTLQRARSPAGNEIGVLLRRLREELRVDAPVRIRVSDDISTPAVTGWRRPVILVPQDIADILEPEQLAGVLAHELVHVRSRHFPVNLGQRALDCLCIFNPFVLWISARIREEREVHCDRVAAGTARGGHRKYVEALLELETLRAPVGPALVGLFGEGRLLRRMRRLVDTRQRNRRGEYRTVALAGLAALSTLVVVALFSSAMVSLTSWAVMSHDIQVRTEAAAAAPAAGVPRQPPHGLP